MWHIFLKGEVVYDFRHCRSITRPRWPSGPRIALSPTTRSIAASRPHGLTYWLTPHVRNSGVCVHVDIHWACGCQKQNKYKDIHEYMFGNFHASNHNVETEWYEGSTWTRCRHISAVRSLKAASMWTCIKHAVANVTCASFSILVVVSGFCVSCVAVTTLSKSTQQYTRKHIHTGWWICRTKFEGWPW